MNSRSFNPSEVIRDFITAYVTRHGKPPIVTFKSHGDWFCVKTLDTTGDIQVANWKRRRLESETAKLMEECLPLVA